MKKLCLLIFLILPMIGMSQVGSVVSEYGFNRYQPVDLLFEDTLSIYHNIWDQAGTGAQNPWTSVRLTVQLKCIDTGSEYEVRGYYAADGNAAYTKATGGNFWKARFVPGWAGQYRAIFIWERGYNLNLYDYGFGAGFDTYIDTAIFYVNAGFWNNSNLSKYGPVYFNGFGHYPKYWNGKDFRPVYGSDSPENRLAYDGFEDTYAENDGKDDNLIRPYAPHYQDTSLAIAPIPSWDQYKGLFGEAAYLYSKGARYISFLINNVKGDDENCWPYIQWSNMTNGNETPQQYNFNVMKLERWQDYLDFLRLHDFMVEFKLWETENDRMFTPNSRAIYLNVTGASLWGWYPCVKVNLGEENDWNDEYTNGVDSIKKYADWIVKEYQYDTVNRPIVVVHTYANDADRNDTYGPMLNHRTFSGPSLQLGNHRTANEDVRQWLEYSETGTKDWVAFVDENGPYQHGTPPNPTWPGYNSSVGYDYKSIYVHWVWEVFFSQGLGSAFYYGYQQPENDLNCDDQRSRDSLWSLCGNVNPFFDQFPLAQMTYATNLLGDNDHHLLAAGDTLFAYFNINDNNDDFQIKLPSGPYTWTIVMYDIFNGNWSMPINFTSGTYPIDGNGFTHIPFTGQAEVAAMIFRDSPAGFPVRFVQFYGEQVDAGVELTWEVAEEDNISFYYVERLNKNREFEAIDSVLATNSHIYKYIDRTVTTGRYYYQIQAKDPAQWFDFSDQIQIDVNQFSREIELFGNTYQVGYDYKFINIQGQEVDINSVSSGIYYLVRPPFATERIVKYGR